MNRYFDNWERLVTATLRREELRELARTHSRDPSLDSVSSDFSFTSPLHEPAVATSRTTGNITTSTGSRNVSGNSHFSAASGGYETSPSGQILPLPNFRMFSFSELKAATRNFRSDRVLGEGGFGKVYKGWLEEKGGSATVIAVKKLNADGFQGFEEWQSEVNFLGRLSHPNLIKLLGYCWEGTELLLVYEFMQKGCLENHLFGRGSAVLPLPWDTRLKILIGAARGLAFLHALDRKVTGRDFKASNILLDGSYNAKISDYCYAKMGPTPSKSHVTTRVVGTYGYAAPEYVATGHLYVKSDVYGFGGVLVEMLTGLRILDENRPDGKHNLVEWVKPHLFHRRKLKSIMDSRLEGKYPSRSAIQIAQLALSCIESEPKHRPSMREIVEILERIDFVHEKHKDVIVNSGPQPSSRAQKPSQYRSPVHHPRHDHSPIHPRQDHSPIHPRHDRNRHFRQVEFKKAFPTEIVPLAPDFSPVFCSARHDRSLIQAYPLPPST